MAHVLLNQRSWPLNCSSCHHLRWWCIILNSLDHIRSWCMLLYNYNRCFSAGRYYIVSWCMILYNCNLCYSASRYSYVQPLCRLCTQSFKLQIPYHDPQKHIGIQWPQPDLMGWAAWVLHLAINDPQVQQASFLPSMSSQDIYDSKFSAYTPVVYSDSIDITSHDSHKSTFFILGSLVVVRSGSSAIEWR